MCRNKFSVLLPTRNRLDLLAGAVATIRHQRYDNWEIIIADNCSDDDVEGFVRRLDDRRIIYSRSDSPLPVTDNWNRAIDMASGDLIVMLGDDDGLTPSYFERCLDIFAKLGQPDFLYHGAYHFAYPGALEAEPGGYLADVTPLQSILYKRPATSLMSREEARQAVMAALSMRMTYGFNMQYFAFRAEFIEKLRQYGPVFQGPFPDFYAANMAMLLGESIGLAPEPLVVIGISPKSYGHFHFNRRERAGIEFLGTGGDVSEVPASVRSWILPGSNMNTSWLASVAVVHHHLGNDMNLTLDVSEYRRRQIFYVVDSWARRLPAEAALSDIWDHLVLREKLFALALSAVMFPWRILPGTLGQIYGELILRIKYASRSTQRPPKIERITARFSTMKDVFDYLSCGYNK